MARGAWEDFKASVKNAGKKIKDAFGKKAEEDTIEALKEEEEKEEDMQRRAAEAEEAEMMARGAWDDFKASVKKAGKKVKDAFGIRMEEDSVEEQRDEEEEEEEREEEEEDSDMSARGAWEDFKASVRKAGQKIKDAFGKKEEGDMLSGEELEDLRARLSGAQVLLRELMKKREMKRAESERKRKEEREQAKRVEAEAAKALQVRGSWDDFKQELRKMRFKLKERLGKRSNSDALLSFRRDLEDLRAIQSALAALKKDAIEAGLENDPDIINLIKETEALAHQLEVQEG